MQGLATNLIKAVVIIYLLIFSGSLFSDVLFVGDNASSKTQGFSSYVYDKSNALNFTGSDLYVSVGGSGLKEALSKGLKPLLATYITEGNFYSVLKEYGALEHKGIGAVFWESDIRYQYLVARELIPTGRIVAFYASNSVGSKDRLPNDITWIPFEGELFDALESLPNDTAAVLAVADPEIYSRSSLRAILKYLLYERGIPLIGYTKFMVGNGALASPVSSETEYWDSVISSISNFHLDSTSRKVWVKPTSVEFNKLLARSLQIKLPPKKDIERKLIRSRESGK